MRRSQVEGFTHFNPRLQWGNRVEIFTAQAVGNCANCGAECFTKTKTASVREPGLSHGEINERLQGYGLAPLANLNTRIYGVNTTSEEACQACSHTVVEAGF